MPFRHLMPMVDEMSRHRAQAMLRVIGAARLAQADPTATEVRTAVAGIERQAGRDAPPPVDQGLDQVRAMLQGMEEV